MTFNDAINVVHKGQKVTRYIWNDPNKYMYLQKRNTLVKICKNGKIIRIKYSSHINLHTENCTYISWVPDNGDLNAKDWFILI